MEGVGAAISAVVADECNRVLGQELSEEEEAAHADLVRDAKGEELHAGCMLGARKREM